MLQSRSSAAGLVKVGTRGLLIGALGAGCVALSTHQGTLLLLSLVGVFGIVASRWLPWDVAIPVAVAALILGSTWLGLLSWWTGSRWIGSSASALACVIVLVAVAAAVLRLPHRRILASLPRNRWTAVAYVPTALALVGAGANAVSFEVVKRWIAVTMDGAEHAFFIHQIREIGALDYSVTLYPRGLHTVVAIAYEAAGQPEDLSTQLHAGATLTWLAFALLLGSVTSVTMRLGRGSSTQKAVLGLGAAVAVLVTNNFVGMFVLFSAHATLVGMSLLLIPAQMARADAVVFRRWMLVTLPLLAGVVSELWSAMLLPVVVLAVVVAADHLQLLRRSGWRWLIQEARYLGAATLLGVPLAVPVLSAIAAKGGLSVAGSAGLPYVPGYLGLSLGALGLFWLVWHVRERTARYLAAVVLGTTATAGVLLLGSGHPDNLYQWYPTKALWMALILAYPATAVAIWSASAFGARIVARGTSRCGPMRRSANLAAGAMAAMLAVVVLGQSFWLFTLRPVMVTVPFRPWPAVASSDSGYRGYELAQLSQRRVDVARYIDTHVLSDDRQIAVPIAVGYSPIFDARASFVVSKLLRLSTGQGENQGFLANACADVTAVAGLEDATVVTALDEDLVRTALQRQGCGDLPIVEVPWPASVVDPSQLLSSTSPSQQRRGS